MLRNVVGAAVAGAALVACGGNVAQPAADDDAGGEGGGAVSSSGGTGSSGGGLPDATPEFDGSTGFEDGSTGFLDATGPGQDATGPGVDATTGVDSGGGDLLDAAFDVTPPPTGEAGFAFIVNGTVLAPLTCPAYNWEFAPPASFFQGDGGQPLGDEAVCYETSTLPCPGTVSALIVNTGQVPLAYTAQAVWSLPASYPPGVNFGEPGELVGVLSPGARVDVASVLAGGIVAVVGASEPFSNMGHYVSDEGMLPWPAGVAGSGGSMTMYVAEINLANDCHMPTIVW